MTRVNLFGSQIGDTELGQLQKHLERLPQLESLELFGPKVTDDGLKHLEGLTQLQCLSISFAEVTDDGLNTLQDWLDSKL